MVIVSDFFDKGGC